MRLILMPIRRHNRTHKAMAFQADALTATERRNDVVSSLSSGRFLACWRWIALRSRSTARPSANPHLRQPPSHSAARPWRNGPRSIHFMGLAHRRWSVGAPSNPATLNNTDRALTSMSKTQNRHQQRAAPAPAGSALPETQFSRYRPAVRPDDSMTRTSSLSGCSTRALGISHNEQTQHRPSPRAS